MPLQLPLRLFYDYISTPSAYPGQPVQHFLNQWGHTGIGGILGLVLGPISVLGVLVYALVIEVPQYVFWGGTFWDCVEDTAHVAVGALIVTLTPWLLLLSLVSIGLGSLLRLRTLKK